MEWYKASVEDIKVDGSKKFTLYYDFKRILGKIEFYILKDGDAYEKSGHAITFELFVFTPYAGKWHHVESVETSSYYSVADLSHEENLFDELNNEIEDAIEAMERYKNLYESALEDN